MDIDDTPDSERPPEPDGRTDTGPPPSAEPGPPASGDADGPQSDPIEIRSRTDRPSRPWIRPVLFTVVSLLMLALVASQTYLIMSLGQAKSDISSLEADIATLGTAIDDAETAVGEISDEVAGLTEDIDSVKGVRQGAADTSPAPSAVEGFLPRFAPGAQDTALGLVLPEITALDAYGNETVTIDPSDGVKRIWIVWAHWCPYCQEELPMMAEWYPPNAARFPNAELVTVTTAMDPSRGNPLDEYLDAQQFPFPVLRDEDGKLSAQFGVSAFPFWVITNGDGTVLFRTAGLLGVDQVDQLFTQLEEFDV